jgi:hypothetical protein
VLTILSRPKLEDVFPVPEEAKRLRVFLGGWKVCGTLTFMDKLFKVEGSAEFFSAAAGWGLLTRVELKVENLGLYEEVDILGFDRNEKTYHFFALTNTAAAYDHKGKWLSNNTLSFTYEDLREGKKYKEELEIKIRTPNEFTIDERDSLGGVI